ncbi:MULTISPECIES: hypothetical protein [unclassified Shewanella]|uniref:hypothetical protein n=1 Tax=unclassified Shewanella TaxID=196818 RepID=UPI0021D9DA7D|nr:MULTISPECIES: hypothetical protein [unclassified Shewanella]MCU8036427.1 hypothetical protein [Shewanella sp. SM71]MCU8098374.1 hypothetical protein [Shewanella sp. SM102]
MTLNALIDSDLHTDNVVIRTKVAVYSVPDNPHKSDMLAYDGIMMYGYRKVREINGIGFVFAHKMKFGNSDLLKHKGRWVLVDVSDYWTTTARVGFSHPHDGVQYSGVRCKALSV